MVVAQFCSCFTTLQRKWRRWFRHASVPNLHSGISGDFVYKLASDAIDCFERRTRLSRN